MLLTRRGWTVLALAGFAAYAAIRTGQPVLLALMTLTLSALAVSAVCVWRLERGLGIGRAVPEQVFAGDVLPARLDLINSGTAKSLFFLTDRAQIGESEQAVSIAVDLLKSGEQRRVAYEFGTVRRGVCKFQRVTAESRAPFGLLAWRRERPVVSSTVVLPFPGRVFDWDCPGGRRHSGIGVESLDRSGATNEYFGVRDYSPGDPIRHVHWKQTARTRQIKVREFQTTSSLEVEILPDLSKADYSSAEGAEILEAVISLTASLCAETIRRGYFVRLWTLGRRIGGTLLEAGPGHLRSMLLELARMEATRDDAYADALMALRAHLAPRAAVISVCPHTALPGVSQWAGRMISAGFSPQLMIMEPAGFRALSRQNNPQMAGMKPAFQGAVFSAGAPIFRFCADEDFRNIRMPIHAHYPAGGSESSG